MNRIVLDGDEEYRLFDSVVNGCVAGYITQDVQLILRKCSDMRGTIRELTAETERLRAERDNYKATISQSIAEHDLGRKMHKRRKELVQAAGLVAIFVAANIGATMIAFAIMRMTY